MDTPYHTPMDTALYTGSGIQRQKQTQTSIQETGNERGDRRSKQHNTAENTFSEAKKVSGFMAEPLEASLSEHECRIITFPLSRRAATVRRVASVFYSKSAAARGAYWRSQISLLTRGLRRIGLGDDEIDAQVEAFRNAVQAEINSFPARKNGAA